MNAKGWSLFQRTTGRLKGRWVLTLAGGRQVLAPVEIRQPRAAQEWAAAYLATAAIAPHQPRKRRAEGPTIADKADDWIKLRKADEDLAPSTIKDNRSHLDTWILPKLGPVPLAGLTIPVLRVFVREVSGKVSPSASRNILSTLATFVDDAIGEGWISPGPNLVRERSVRGELPDVPRKRRMHLTPAIVELLINSGEIPVHRRVRYAIAALTGLRDGEIAGLRWCDVDFDRKLLDIRQAFTNLRAVGKLKTDTSERLVPMHPQLVELLRWWHDEGWELFCCKAPKMSDFVLPDEKGHASRPRSAGCLRADLERIGQEGIVEGRPYQFRHLRTSFATWLRRAGHDIETIGTLLGHAGRSVTAEHYADEDIERLRGVVSVITVVINLVIAITTEYETTSEQAPPTRVELVTFGLGNHGHCDRPTLRRHGSPRRNVSKRSDSIGRQTDNVKGSAVIGGSDHNPDADPMDHNEAPKGGP